MTTSDMGSAYGAGLAARDILSQTIGALGPNYPYSGMQQFAIFLVLFFPAIAGVVVCARIYSRTITKNFGWDDVFILIAMVFSLASMIPSYFFIKSDFIGIHAKDIPDTANFAPSFFWTWLVQVLYQPIMSSVKASVQIFMLRLGSTSRVIRYACWVLMGLDVGMMVAFLLACIFQCKPIDFYWRWDLQEGSCLNFNMFMLMISVINIATDLATISLPFVLILGLRMHIRVKVAVLVIFSLGIVVTAFSILRLYLTWVSYNLPPGGDPSYSIGFTTGAVETNLAIITASAPAFWPLARRYFPGTFNRIRGSRAFQQDELPRIEDDGNGGIIFMPSKSSGSGGGVSRNTATVAGSTMPGSRGGGDGHARTSLERREAANDMLSRPVRIIVRRNSDDLSDAMDEDLEAQVAGDEARTVLYLDHYHHHILEAARRDSITRHAAAAESDSTLAVDPSEEANHNTMEKGGQHG